MPQPQGEELAAVRQRRDEIRQRHLRPGRTAPAAALVECRRLVDEREPDQALMPVMTLIGAQIGDWFAAYYQPSGFFVGLETETAIDDGVVRERSGQRHYGGNGSGTQFRPPLGPCDACQHLEVRPLYRYLDAYPCQGRSIQDALICQPAGLGQCGGLVHQAEICRYARRIGVGIDQ